MSLPLSSHPIASTTDPERAQAVLSRELMNLRFQSLRDRQRFRLDMNGLQLGQTAIAFNQFHSDATVDVGDVDDQKLLLTFGINNPSLVRHDGENVDIHKRLAICSSSRKLCIERTATSGVVFVGAHRKAIESRLQETLDRRPQRPIDFERSIDFSSGLGAQIHRIILFALDECQQSDSILQNPLFRSNLDDMLLSALLMLPSNYSEELVFGHSRMVAPTIVRRAEEFLEGHALDPVNISEVVAICNCSRRALFKSFQKYRGYTPLQFLTECRLKKARARLLSPSRADTVSLIAFSCGFSHMGRFSAVYKKRFGERPSETLRQERAVDEIKNHN